MPPTRTSPAHMPSLAVANPRGSFAEPYRQVYYARYMPMFKNPYTKQTPEVEPPKDPRPPALVLRDLECQTVLGKGQSQVLLVKNKRRVHPLDAPTAFALKAVRRKAVRKTPIHRDAHPLPEDDQRRRKGEIERHHSDANLERKALTLVEWSPFVTGLIDCFADSQALYMNLEYVPGATLRGVLKNSSAPFASNTVRFFLANILCALDHLRGHGIAHRDIKPENILVAQDGYLILTDFGSAAMYDDTVAPWKDVGTPWYRAPEMDLDSRYNPQDEPYALDIWSTGCILYELLTRRMAFCEFGVIQTYLATLKGIPSWPEQYRISRQAKDLVHRMLLIHSPSDRIGAREVDEIFEHPWMQSIDKLSVMKKKYLAPICPPNFIEHTFWQKEPLPQRSHFPGLTIPEPHLLLAHDDRVPKRPEAASR